MPTNPHKTSGRHMYEKPADKFMIIHGRSQRMKDTDVSDPRTKMFFVL